MDNTTNIKNVLCHFNITHVTNTFGNGHINDTYRIEGEEYILQRINTSIFTRPAELMENIENVTAFLRHKIAASGGDPDRETLTVIKSTDGSSYYKLDDDNVFRVYKYIAETKTIENDKTLDDLYQAGIGFGRFQKLLSDYPVETLHETIRDFHHTPRRIEALKAAIQEDKAGRAPSVKAEVAFALRNADFADKVIKAMESGQVPIRVTHNDTKINNILFDDKSGEAVCVIDLDTVMPGSVLYDFGDALRMGGSTALEDEVDLSKVHFDTNAFKAFAGGYLAQMKEELTPKELELLPFSVKLLTYECGVGFLTDYLNGDTYFKIHRLHQNLDRARNQFKLVEEIAEREAELAKVVERLCGR